MAATLRGSLIFTCVGGALVFGCEWTIVDATSRVVIKQRGRLVPMHTVTHRVDEGAVVVLGFDEGDSDSTNTPDAWALTFLAAVVVIFFVLPVGAASKGLVRSRGPSACSRH